MATVNAVTKDGKLGTLIESYFDDKTKLPMHSIKCIDGEYAYRVKDIRILSINGMMLKK